MVLDFSHPDALPVMESSLIWKTLVLLISLSMHSRHFSRCPGEYLRTSSSRPSFFSWPCSSDAYPRATALSLFLHEYFERRDTFPGGILVPQTFGGMANWNPHVHSLITDACWDREGKQYAIPEIGTADLKVIEELFATLHGIPR